MLHGILVTQRARFKHTGPWGFGGENSGEGKVWDGQDKV